jgi:uracil-DNA glycosylase
VTKERGSIRELGGQPVLVTIHPSYLLRLPEARTAELEYERFVADLKLAAPWCRAAAE